MSTIHHSLARRACESILANYTSGAWENDLFSNRLRYATTKRVGWPQPDGLLADEGSDEQGTYTIAVELKPPSESRRGCMTGVGQALAYLDSHSASLLVLPKYVNECPSFPIARFTADLLSQRLNLQDLALGVVAYDPATGPDGPLELEVLRQLPQFELQESKAKGQLETTYWANWRDTSPDVLFVLLALADRERGRGQNRLEAIWNDYWTRHYCVNGAEHTLDDVPSKLLQFGLPNSGGSAKRVIPFRKAKQILLRRIQSGEITYRAARADLLASFSPNVRNSNYFGLWKNHFNFIRQLGLWDSNGFLTRDGVILLQIGRTSTPQSVAFRDVMAKLVLTTGKHLELLIDFDRVSLTMRRIRGTDQVRRKVFSDLASKNLVKRNPGRRTGGMKEPFADEQTLWGHLGLVRKNGGKFFFPGRGYAINWERIASLLTLPVEL